MTYLEQFARKRRNKENTTVLTARLPESLYLEFKMHCDNLGLSISEGIGLLVERETSNLQGKSRVVTNIENKTNNDELIATTNEHNKTILSNTIKHNKNTTVVTNTNKMNSKRFTVKQFEFNGELPCPICGEWKTASNFSRHAKGHGTTTEGIFIKEQYQKKAESMIEEKRRL